MTTARYMPPQVDPKDLQDKANARLLNADQCAAVKAKFNALGTNFVGRVRKSEFSKDIAVPYSVTKTADGKLYAIYKGKDKLLGFYKKNKLLGKGGFGKVKLAQNIETGEWVALKIMVRQDKNVSNLQDAEHEVDKLYMPGVGMGRGSAYQRQKKGTGEFQSEFLMKLAPGTDMRTFIEKNTRLPLATRAMIAKETLNLFKKLHDRGVLHCDIKPENVQIDTTTIPYVITIVDFGNANLFLPGKLTSMPSALIYTPKYIAPELMAEYRSSTDFKDDVTYTDKSDVYAMGVTLANLLNINLAQIDKNRQTRRQDPRLEAVYTLPLNETHLSGSSISACSNIVKKLCLDLINKMLATDPSQRPTMAEVEHQWNRVEFLIANVKESDLALLQIGGQPPSPKEGEVLLWCQENAPHEYFNAYANIKKSDGSSTVMTFMYQIENDPSDSSKKVYYFIKSPDVKEKVTDNDIAKHARMKAKEKIHADRIAASKTHDPALMSALQATLQSTPHSSSHLPPWFDELKTALKEHRKWDDIFKCGYDGSGLPLGEMKSKDVQKANQIYWLGENIKKSFIDNKTDISNFLVDMLRIIITSEEKGGLRLGGHTFVQGGSKIAQVFRDVITKHLDESALAVLKNEIDKAQIFKGKERVEGVKEDLQEKTLTDLKDSLIQKVELRLNEV